MAERRRQSLKAQRKDKKRHKHNLLIKTELKKTLKKLQGSIAGKNIEEAKPLLNIVYKKIDKLTKRNILKANTAARRKSYYSRLMKNIV